MKVHDHSDTDFMLDLHKDVTSGGNSAQDFPLFDSPDSDPLALPGDIKQEEVDKVIGSFIKRVKVCIAANGHRFEYKL